MAICSVDGCEKKVNTKGLCNKHFQRMKRTGTTDPGPLSLDHGVRICSVPDCGRKRRANGLCPKHYLRVKLTGTVDIGPKAHGTLEERFWRKVTKSESCWIWSGSKRPNGYGTIQRGGKNSPTLLAHRVSCELHHGPIPRGCVVMHSCDNPSCVNPEHLLIGTHKDNTGDMDAKGRRVTIAPLGVQNGKSVLDDDKVRYIRQNPERSHAALARELGVGATTVRGVRIGRCWTHVK